MAGKIRLKYISEAIVLLTNLDIKIRENQSKIQGLSSTVNIEYP